ncbi:olfactory receptor 52L1-like [Engraulis encrasicolus]|uniref:olfactory receptor 52L1-like n=1 Tax=Engraulis encrasicolus TaxID=184585 RepID=UPI002FD6467D
MLDGLLSSTAAYPRAVAHLATNVYSVSYAACLAEAYFHGIYGSTMYTTLTVMAYDRYVSIFQPLQYHAIMTPRKVRVLLVVANLLPVLLNTYTLIANFYGVCSLILLVGLPILLVLISYLKIIVLTYKLSADARKKAFTTCTAHLIVFLNFSLCSLFSVVYNRFNAKVPIGGHVFLTTSYTLWPPVLHPIVYGVKNQEIRKRLSKITRSVLLRTGCQLRPKTSTVSIRAD